MKTNVLVYFAKPNKDHKWLFFEIIPFEKLKNSIHPVNSC